MASINPSSLKSIEDYMGYLKEHATSMDIEDIINIHNGDETALVCSFFFNIFTKEDLKLIWSKVQGISFRNTTLYELFRSINYHIILKMINHDSFIDSDLLDLFILDTRRPLKNIESIEIDIEELTRIYMEKFNISDTILLSNKVSVDLIHNKIDNVEYKLLKNRLVVHALETVKFKDRTAIHNIKDIINSLLNILMIKIIMDDFVEKTYNEERGTYISKYLALYARMDRYIFKENA